MIALTRKAGSEFLGKKGPTIAIVSILTFMAWILLWPQGLNIDKAVGQEPETTRYEESATYSSDATELMRISHELFTRSLSILDNKKYYCLMRTHLDGSEMTDTRSFTLSRYERLCGIFSDAAALVDTYADRLRDHARFRPGFYEFAFHAGGQEQRIGPFLSVEECSRITARLMQLGEQVFPCLPYAKSRYPLVFDTGAASL
ncbi:hypothetical protein HNO52_06640 [Billgrantia diversa]|uniref:hypothetical protein n=1 Tax=Halomonas sp. MCCC 1A13316 TaxID=2733487 RepID=UPI0018A52F8E|nr:hypothetical protein [Halomonas sp. MCCC 1A13316]QOR38224.1 hypothetical protein HNO52_06640 [Halomonas sp. MCCC 1A13316]